MSSSPRPQPTGWTTCSPSTPSSRRELADPAVHADQAAARRLGRRTPSSPRSSRPHRALDAGPRRPRRRPRAGRRGRVVRAPRPTQLEARQAELEAQLRELLLPKDPDDDKDVILEVKAGEGGEESALFAGDLLRMYLRYAERRGLEDRGARRRRVRPRRLQGRRRRDQVARTDRGRLGPAEVRGRRAPRAAGAGHRVAGPHPHLARPACWCCPRPRRSTSRSTRTTCASTSSARPGPGGQSVNTTDSAVRITHLPTGIVVSLARTRRASCRTGSPRCGSCAPGCSRRPQEAADAEASDQRRSQVRTVDRSERVRTYNFPENRITDHRVGFKAYNLDQVLDGDLDAGACDALDAARHRRAAGGRRPERPRRCSPTPTPRLAEAGVSRPGGRRAAARARARRARAAGC